MAVEMTVMNMIGDPPDFKSSCRDFEVELRDLLAQDRMAAFARCIYELNEISLAVHLRKSIRKRAAEDFATATIWARRTYDKRQSMSPEALGSELDRGIELIIRRTLGRKTEVADFVSQSWDRMVKIFKDEA